MTTDYPEIDDFIFNNLNPEDFDNYYDFLNAIQDLFKRHYNSEVEQTTIDIWNEIQPEPEEEIEEVKETPAQEIKIDRILESDTTKKIQVVEILETIKREITPKEFANLTGMNYNTVRRELPKGVKEGRFRKIRKGVYEAL